MPANNISNYRSNTSNENNQTSLFKFRPQNKPANPSKTYSSAKRAKNFSSTLFGSLGSSRSRLTGASAKTLTQRGIGTYRRNAEFSKSAKSIISRGADLYLKAGPKLLSENSLFTRNTYSQSPLNILSSRINTYINRGITQFQGITSTISNSTNLLPRGKSVFLQPARNSINTGTSSTRTFSARTGSTPIIINSTLIKKAISQYQAGNKSQQSSNFLSSAADLYLKTGMKNLQTATLFQFF